MYGYGFRRSFVQRMMGVVRRIGVAVIGGDLSGNPRGAGALDIQCERTAATQVAAGAQAIAVGTRLTASGEGAVALGRDNLASGFGSVAVGVGDEASGVHGVAIGAECRAAAANAMAMGYKAGASNDGGVAVGYWAESRVMLGNKVSGLPVIPHGAETALGTGSDASTIRHCGPLVVLMTHELDLKTTGTQGVWIPPGVTVWVQEVGVIVTERSGITVEPTIQFGSSVDEDAYLTPRKPTRLQNVGRRERWVSESWDLGLEGPADLAWGATVAATGTALRGRGYFVALVVESEP